ncbi:MAG: hypothetical protein AB1689_20145 [Thermodesulfobacteriota bacterium]
MKSVHDDTIRSSRATRAWPHPGRRLTLLLALAVLAQVLLPHVHPRRNLVAGADVAQAYAATAGDVEQHADAACPVCQALSHRPALAPMTGAIVPRPIVLSWTPAPDPPRASACLLARHAPRSPPATL